MSTPQERRRLLAEIRKVNRQLAVDASAARKRSLEALKASAKMTKANLPGHGKSFHPSSAGRAIRFPKALPRSYSRAGVTYHLSATMNLDGTSRSTFHMRMTNCNDTSTAAAHQSYIDREQAVTFSAGNIAETSADRQKFWTSLEAGVINRLGSISLPKNLPKPQRTLLAQTLLSRQPPLKTPPRIVIRAWQRTGARELRIGPLDQETFESISQEINTAWTAQINADYSPPSSRPHQLPSPLKSRPPHRAIQRRIILELPHEVTDQAREEILTQWLRANLAPHNALYHAVIHRPPPGNDQCNWHAHIAKCHYDVPRKPESFFPDISAIKRPLPLNALGTILSRNAPGLTFHKKSELAKQTIKTMRTSYSATANEHLRTVASSRRYDPRSYADQGLAITRGTHRGTNASALHKRGIPTRWNDHARQWLNAALAAASTLTNHDADDILDSVENRMILDSLPEKQSAFPTIRFRDQQHLSSHLTAAERAIDKLAEPLPNWPDSWQHLSASLPPSALHSTRFARPSPPGGRRLVQLIYARRVNRRTDEPPRGIQPVSSPTASTRRCTWTTSTRASSSTTRRAVPCLRTETVINDTYDFRSGRRLGNLEDLQKIGFAANRRLLRVQSLSHDTPPGSEAFENLHRPAVHRRTGRAFPALRRPSCPHRAGLPADLQSAPHDLRKPPAPGTRRSTPRPKIR